MVDEQQINVILFLHVLRLVKLFRIVRSSHILQRWQNYLDLSFAKPKLVRFMGITLLSSHWLGCAWGMAGRTFGTELCSRDGLPLVIADLQPRDASWLKSLFIDGKFTQNNICNRAHVYAASLHYAFMLITSIKYGDIVPTQFESTLLAEFARLSEASFGPTSSARFAASSLMVIPSWRSIMAAPTFSTTL